MCPIQVTFTGFRRSICLGSIISLYDFSRYVYANVMHMETGYNVTTTTPLKQRSRFTFARAKQSSGLAEAVRGGLNVFASFRRYPRFVRQNESSRERGGKTSPDLWSLVARTSHLQPRATCCTSRYIHAYRMLIRTVVTIDLARRKRVWSRGADGIFGSARCRVNKSVDG